MKCKNNIIEIKFKNGKNQILTDGIVSSEWLSKINGTHSKGLCNGNVNCLIFAESSYDDGCGSNPEIVLIFKCEKCGKEYNLPYTIEDVQTLFQNSI